MEANGRTVSVRGNSRLFPQIAAVLVIALAVAGCESRTGQGAAGGAAIGAGFGLLIGALAGDAGAGLAAGAAVGAAQGTYEGWRQEQDDQRTRQVTAAIREAKASGSQQASADPTSRSREELTRFLGVWSVEGWAQEPGGERLNVRARAQGNVEMTYFVEVAFMDIQVNGEKLEVWGTTTLGFDDDTGYTLTSRFNTLPEPDRANGSFDPASRSFTFANDDGKMVIRFETPDRATSETIVGGQTVEQYTFTRN